MIGFVLVFTLFFVFVPQSHPLSMTNVLLRGFLLAIVLTILSSSVEEGVKGATVDCACLKRNIDSSDPNQRTAQSPEGSDSIGNN